MFERIMFFNENYLGLIWIIGCIFALFLLSNFLFEKYKFNKFDNEKQMEKRLYIDKLKQDKSKK